MKTNFRRWLPAITTRKNNVVLGLAALAVAGGVVAGTASGGMATPENPTAVAADTKAGNAKAAKPADTKAAKPADTKAKAASKPPAVKKAVKLPAAKSVKHSFQLQSTYFYCGPAATRVALSAHGKVFSQDKVANLLGTTTNGTDSAYDVTRALNKQLGKGRYHTVEIPGQKATAKQIARLKTDVVTAINQGDPVVANIAGTMRDTNGQVHSYEGGHYVPVIGYTNNGNTVRIADSADNVGSAYYNVSVKTLAHWIATRGYSA